MSDRLVVHREALKELLASKSGPVAKDLLRRALQVEARAKRNLSTPGSGRQYGRHTASAPGDPPAVDTGRLRASITHELAAEPEGLVARVGTDVDYALPLELGTRHIAPRPFLRPALNDGGRT